MSVSYKNPEIICCPEGVDEEEWILELAFARCVLEKGFLKVQTLKQDTIRSLRDCNFTVIEKAESEIDIDYHMYTNYLPSSSTYSWHIYNSYYSPKSSNNHLEDGTYLEKIIHYTLIKYDH